MVLLEVLLSIALFAMGAAVVGTAMRTSLRAAGGLRVRAEAMNLAETVFARLATGEVELAAFDETAFDEEDPTWTYAIALDPVDDENPALLSVTVTVSNGPAANYPQTFSLTQWIFDPGAGEEETEY